LPKLGFLSLSSSSVIFLKNQDKLPAANADESQENAKDYLFKSLYDQAGNLFVRNLLKREISYKEKYPVVKRPIQAPKDRNRCASWCMIGAPGSVTLSDTSSHKLHILMKSASFEALVFPIHILIATVLHL
jgi:hypothetical protein